MKLTPKKLRKGKGKLKFKLSWKDSLLYGFLFFFLLMITFGLSGLSDKKEIEEVPLSKVVTGVKDGKIKQITVSDNTLEIEYKNGDLAKSKKEEGASLYQILNDAGVDPTRANINIEDKAGLNTWLGILGTFLPVLLIIGFFYFIFRRAKGAQDNILSFGSSKAKAISKVFPKVTFDEVAGVDEAKEELTEIVDFLKNPDKYHKMGARTPKGVLMVGASGTGKTLLARAVAGEARVAFFSIAGSEFMEMLVGVGAARVRDLFNNAKKSQPAIIFIDEIDAIGRQRGASGMMGGHDEREQTLNQILVEMDGFTPTEQLVVIGATNRPDVLDPALIRPGRFDRRIMLTLPDILGRKSILKIHAKGKPFNKSVNWDNVARRTVGFSGADLENILNEAAILAARGERKEIKANDIEEAAIKVKMGPQKKRLQSEEDKKITAYHESGHAIVSYAMPQSDPVRRISIVGRAMSLGHTDISPLKDRVHETKTRLLETVATLLGGRVSEELIFSEMTTGAADDIEKATEIARAMVTEYGMSNLGPINLGSDKQIAFMEKSSISESMQGEIDNEVKRILGDGYKRATEVLKKNRARLDDVASVLLKKETIEGEEFASIMKGAKGKRTKSSVK